MGWWQWLLSFLAWLSADPAAVNVEQPRTAAAVAVAYAAFAPESPEPPPSPPSPACACGGTCVDGKWRPDGRIVQPCPCPPACRCKSKPNGA
jgi:hypothetical protein